MCPPHPSPSTRVYRARAFTLVEVTIAIGIVAFAMTAMLGLLPLGLTTFQDAATLNVRSQVVQAIASDVARSESTNIIGGTFYFDNEGNALSASDSRSVYTATVTVDTLGVLEPLGIHEKAGRRVIIHVTNLRTAARGGGTPVVDYPMIIPNS